jgi:cation diffusion facilitator CzcD-associated flavoprotein CzcO
MTTSFRMPLPGGAIDGAARFEPRDAVHDVTAPTTASATDFPIAIIGAGFAGIGAAIRLKQAGIESFTIFERAGEVGGTWRDNTYPGAACDVPSHAYSLSFEPKPDWSRRYAPSEEIHTYLLGLVAKHGLRRHLRLNTTIVDARFDAKRGVWTLTDARGVEFAARVVLSCMGGLIDPSFPDVAGIRDFAGEVMHTARWNHSYDLAGKRVAVIGTGASAVQVVPSIAGKVAQLTVFQRTPAWVVPKMDKVYSAKARSRFARFPLLLRLSRAIKYWYSELWGPIIILDSPRLSELGRRMSLAHLAAQVRRPELRAKLTPSFQFGCKRILISDDYWATFERDNVELVTEPIETITNAGIATKDGVVREFDAIVFATGFELNIAKAPFPVRGLGATLLDQAWKDGAVAYKGMSVAGFPNWFIMMGPNTGPGHTSVLVYTEAQIAHAVQAIRKIKRENLRYVNVRREVQDRYNARLQGRMKYTVWSTGCTSWYLSRNGANHSLYPGLAAEYVVRARKFKPSDYELASFGSPAFRAPTETPA